mgnify:CR=1 FL=1
MPVKYTTTTLKKMETLFEELGYVIRYEKGNFQSGYCLVENKRIAVINKFYETEGRINCLLDIIAAMEVDNTQLSEKSAKFYKEIRQTTPEESTNQ